MPDFKQPDVSTPHFLLTFFSCSLFCIPSFFCYLYASLFFARLAPPSDESCLRAFFGVLLLKFKGWLKWNKSVDDKWMDGWMCMCIRHNY